MTFNKVAKIERVFSHWNYVMISYCLLGWHLAILNVPICTSTIHKCRSINWYKVAWLFGCATCPNLTKILGSFMSSPP